MKLYKSDKVRFIFGLIFIILVFSWYYIYFAENKNIAVIPKTIQHIIKLLITIIVYFIGTFHLGKLKDSWLSSIWHLVHITGLSIITAIGLYHWCIAEISINVKNFAGNIQEILISPMLYIAMGLINNSLNKKSGEIKKN